MCVGGGYVGMCTARAQEEGVLHTPMTRRIRITLITTFFSRERQRLHMEEEVISDTLPQTNARSLFKFNLIAKNIFPTKSRLNEAK